MIRPDRFLPKTCCSTQLPSDKCGASSHEIRGNLSGLDTKRASSPCPTFPHVPASASAAAQLASPPRQRPPPQPSPVKQGKESLMVAQQAVRRGSPQVGRAVRASVAARQAEVKPVGPRPLPVCAPRRGTWPGKGGPPVREPRSRQRGEDGGAAIAPPPRPRPAPGRAGPAPAAARPRRRARAAPPTPAGRAGRGCPFGVKT